jgi:hypothetical protein
MPAETEKITRARARRWFQRNFPNARIERTTGDTFWLAHSSNIICVRWYRFKFVNPYHCDYVPTPD